jgi:peptide/nickel transport system substrate-binding protein
LLLFSLGLLLACSGPPRRDTSKIFRVNAHSGIASLDPAFARDQYSIWAANLLYNGLVQMDRSLRVQPALAKSWEITDSNTRYTFHLRKGIYFHEDDCFGDARTRTMTAADVVYSFERLRSAELAAPGAWVFKSVKTITALNDTTLAITLSQPFPPFLGILSMKYCSVIPKEAVDYYGNDFREHPIGTGPFYKKLWEANEKLVLRKNERYWEQDSMGKALPYLEAVAISFIPDKQSAFMEFVKGNMDLLSGIDPSYKDEILTFEGDLQPKYARQFEVYRQAYLNTEYLGFLVDSSLVASAGSAVRLKKVRQAINYGFDRQTMLKYLRNSIGTPGTTGIIPKGLEAYDAKATYGYHYNREKAAQLLVEAGFPQGKGLPEITLQTNSSYLDLCEYLQAELLHLGIRLKVEVTPPSTLRQAIATSKVSFFRASWIGDYPDAENYLSLFYAKNKAPNGPNYTQFANAQFDAWYEAAARAEHDSLRLPLYRKMDSLIMEEAAIVPLYYDQVLRFYPRQVHGLEGNAMNMLDLRRVWKE